MLSVLQFELKYRFRRPATYVYFLLMFALGFAGIAWENLTIGGGTGLVKENSPYQLTLMMVVMTAVGFLISSAIMGVPVLRDFQHKTSEMLFTTPMAKGAYLFGRFWGSFIVLLFIYAGLMLGFLIGSVMPWLDEENFLPFNLWHFIQPFLLFVVPNAFFSAALFFMGGALSKRLLFVFVQGVGLLTLYIVTADLTSELGSREMAAIFDPMGINLVQTVGQYWTAAEKNSLLFSFSGLVLWNRIIWIAIGVIALGITYWRFSFHIRKRTKKSRQKQQTELSHSLREKVMVPPRISVREGLQTELQRIFSLSLLYFKEIFRSIPFRAIVLMGIILTVIGGMEFNTMYGTDAYPTTYQVLELIQGQFNLFFIILIVFYAGELIWRERDLNMSQIYDTLPVPNYVGLTAKFLSMVYIHLLLILVLILTGIAIQTVKGYFNYEISIYFSTLFSDQLFFLIIFTLAALFVQVLANQKFLGHALVVLLFLAVTFVFPNIGLGHRMFRFGMIDLGTFSDMNTYGHFVNPFSWFTLYWLFFCGILFVISILLAMRGTESRWATRFKLARLRLSPAMVTAGTLVFIAFCIIGGFIFYNTNILNTYQSPDERKELQANYEKTLKKYEDIPQPRIVETNLEVDIFPEERDFTVEGYYILKNKTAQPISDIHIQHTDNAGVKNEYVNFAFLDSVGEGEAKISESWPEYKYEIYQLSRPLAPGDSLKMNFRSHFSTHGFVATNSNTNVVFNGTFFNNTYFPALGYDRSGELTAKDDRNDYDLPDRERMRERDDPIGQKINLIGDDADHIRFEIVMSTDPDQIALAPGYLQKEWEKDGRKYFHYKMDVPMFNFYSMISARYEVRHEMFTLPDGREIPLEIYYHKGHEYNLDRMMEGMKKSLTYFSREFSPYQYDQMRILEFPRYATFAQSFANTVPFSEGIGFIMDIGEDDVDMAVYVTAHEMAHQWWGHQVTEAQVKGSSFHSETMAQYSALMIMKEMYPPWMMQKFLKHELDRYLRGRAAESKKEQPLEFVENQGYIHYRKGAIVMYALQDYISEDSVNAALKQYVDDWAWRTDRYVTSDILLDYFRQVTPDSLKYIIEDMFQTITLYENRTKTAFYAQTDEGKYQTELDISAVKYWADSLGNENSISFNDWIDVGVYGENEAGKDTLLYLQKHRISGDTLLKITTDQQPTKAGIDPINKLIDRNPDDNVIKVEEKENS